MLVHLKSTDPLCHVIEIWTWVIKYEIRHFLIKSLEYYISSNMWYDQFDKSYSIEVLLT